MLDLALKVLDAPGEACAFLFDTTNLLELLSELRFYLLEDAFFLLELVTSEVELLGQVALSHLPVPFLFLNFPFLLKAHVVHLLLLLVKFGS